MDELLIIIFIPFDVLLDFLEPVGPVRFYFAFLGIPLIPMPEITVTKDSDVIFGQSDIGTAGQGLIIFPVTDAAMP